MDQALSRPARWQASVRRAERAVKKIRELQYEKQDVLDKVQELEKQLEDLLAQCVTECREIDAAVADLVCLQEEYGSWVLPENLLGSRTQQKVDEVTAICLGGLLRETESPDDFDCDNALEIVEEVKMASLPRAFGRD